MDKLHILVVGAGSVGKRHLWNLAQLGCIVSVIDPRQERLIEAGSQVALASQFNMVDEAFNNDTRYDGAVIASPPNVHVDQGVYLINRSVPILLEKPVSPTLEEGLKLQDTISKKTKTPVLLGYTYRWWQPLQDFRSELNSGKLGNILHAKFVMSAHLADWHPWERYQDFFMSQKELGGGALLDESHFLDLMIWFFGMPSRIFAKVEKISSLEINTDDNVDILAVYENGVRVSLHLDLFGRPHEKYISVTGENGTLYWSFNPNQTKFSNGTEVVSIKEYACERNDMFVEVAKEFIEVIRGNCLPSCSLSDGLSVLKIVEACRISSNTEKTVGIAK